MQPVSKPNSLVELILAQSHGVTHRVSYYVSKLENSVQQKAINILQTVGESVGNSLLSCFDERIHEHSAQVKAVQNDLLRGERDRDLIRQECSGLLTK